MKNQKAKGILVIVLFLLITVGIAYIDVYGLMGSGKAEDITLGLDLAGGVSITYQIEMVARTGKFSVFIVWNSGSRLSFESD